MQITSEAESRQMEAKNMTLKKNLNKCCKPIVLLILDGFGITNKRKGNAIKAAKMPIYRALLKKYPNTTLKADGEAVGLPKGEVGNSEAGHQTIGAGRPVLSDKMIIHKAIADKSFFKNPALKQATDHVKKNDSVLHLMGLLTNSQSAHASVDHILAILKFTEKQKVNNMVLHLFTDGRDTHPYHSLKLLGDLQAHMPKNACIASVSGRFYAMDRNRNWQRTKMVYDAIVNGKGLIAVSAAQAIEQAYEKNQSDEFIEPTIIKNSHKNIHIKANDAVIFWNLRSDRARQLTKPFISKNFSGKDGKGFDRGNKIPNLLFVTLTEFSKQLDHAIAAYTHHEETCTLVEALRVYKQIYISESEKYAHVTYFFNGGYDDPRFSEDRIRILSHHVKYFDSVPRMRSKEIAEKVASSVKKGYDFICANFANPDMVAHTGNFMATVKACEAIDKALGVIQKAVVKAGGVLIITADHGNAEQVSKINGRADTHHNANPVPFVLCGCPSVKELQQKGSLSDIAPTVLSLFGESTPKVMTGKNLIKK
jgi:2,3-bisphosphoglycerate-independent phosphoglycerate mutase